MFKAKSVLHPKGQHSDAPRTLGIAAGLLETSTASAGLPNNDSANESDGNGNDLDDVNDSENEIDYTKVFSSEDLTKNRQFILWKARLAKKKSIIHTQIKELYEMENKKKAIEDTADYIPTLQHLEAQGEDHKMKVKNLQKRNGNLEENNKLKAQLYTLTKENEKTKENMSTSEEKAKKVVKAERKINDEKKTVQEMCREKKQADGGTSRTTG